MNSGAEPVTIPSFHDGHVTSIVLGEKAATLGLRQSDGSSYELILEGVEALQVDDFRQGNIINQIDLVSGRHLDGGAFDILERLFPPPHAQSAEPFHRAHSAFLAERTAKIASGEAALVTITPSYGCDLVAYCASAGLHETPSNRSGV